MTGRSDEDLLRVLGEALAEQDPVPDHVLGAARAVPEIADLDFELAVLGFDSTRDEAGVRGPTGTRQLSFSSSSMDVELTIATEQDKGRLVPALDGQVVPSQVVEVSLHVEGSSSPEQTVTSDELGRFRLGGLPDGEIRLEVKPTGQDRDGRGVATGWFRL